MVQIRYGAPKFQIQMVQILYGAGECHFYPLSLILKKFTRKYNVDQRQDLDQNCDQVMPMIKIAKLATIKMLITVVNQNIVCLVLMYKSSLLPTVLIGVHGFVVDSFVHVRQS